MFEGAMINLGKEVIASHWNFDRLRQELSRPGVNLELSGSRLERDFPGFDDGIRIVRIVLRSVPNTSLTLVIGKLSLDLGLWWFSYLPFTIPSQMGTPAKKRKLNNDTKASPASSRSLDYFFGKQKQEPPKPSKASEQNADQNEDTSNLTDEQLARKLQAQWDQEDAPVNRTQADVGDDAEGTAELAERSKESASPKRPGEAKAKAVSRESNEQLKDGNPSPFIFGAKSKNTLSLQSAGTAEDTICSNIPFDESPLTFDPSKYVKELQGHWAAEGGDASYALLTRCFVLVNNTQSRIRIVDALVNMLRVIIEGDPSSLLPTVSMVSHICFLLMSAIFSCHSLYIQATPLKITSDHFFPRCG